MYLSIKDNLVSQGSILEALLLWFTLMINLRLPAFITKNSRKKIVVRLPSS